MTGARRTVATWAAAVVVAAAAVNVGAVVGDAMRHAAAGLPADVFTVDHDPAAPVGSCAPFVITDATDPADIGDMMARGWAGDPTDGREAIYPPGCVIVGP